MKNFFLTAILFAFSSGFLFSQCKLDKSNYQIVLDEEFNYNNVDEMEYRWRFNPADPNFGWGNSNSQDGKGEFYKKSQVSIVSDNNNNYLKLSAISVPETTLVLNGGGKGMRL